MDGKVLLKRLRVMGPSELSRRVMRRLGHRWIENGIEREADRYTDENAIAALLDAPLQVEPRLGDINPVHSEVLRHAEAALNCRTAIFGREIEIGETPDWLADPFGGGNAGELEKLPVWSEKYVQTGLDIRAIWELNRLQVLVDLGRAWRLTGREEFAARAVRLIESWCSQNPFCRSVNWASALEVSLRSISMLLAVNCLRDSRSMADKGLRKLLARQLYLHGQYIAVNTSPPSSGFNHLAGEAAGLALLGEFLPGIPLASRWRIEGLALLRESVQRLILPDGGGLEGSLHYAAFVCRLAAVTTLLYGREARDVLSSTGASRLAAAYHFLSEMTDGGTAVSEFGDGDDAYLPGPPPEKQSERYSGTLNLLWLLADEKTLRHDYVPDADSVWLAGAGRIGGRLESTERMNAEPLVSFPSSGHHVVRPTPGVFARFECGHWGDGITWAHAHADRLSFSLFLNNCPVVIDPGTAAYLSDRLMREYLRSSQAHSTAMVDGMSQGVPLATFMWENEIKSSLTEAALTDFQVLLEGRLELSGYPDMDRPVAQHRRLCFFRRDSRLVVEDFFQADNDHEVEIIFTLHPSCRIKLVGENRAEIGFGGGRVMLRADHGCRIELHRGERDPLRGWYSSGFGRTEPCTQVVLCRNITGNTWIHTELSWAGSDRKILM